MFLQIMYNVIFILHSNILFVYGVISLCPLSWEREMYARCNSLKTLGITTVVLHYYMYIDIKRDTKVFSYTSIIILCLLRRFTAYL